MSSNSKQARRAFLRGAGGITLGLPFLSSLHPRTSQAASDVRRFVAIKSYSTQRHSDWYPAFKGNGYQLKNDAFVGFMPIDDAPGATRYSNNPRADGTTHLTKPIVNGLPYTWAPLSDFAAPSISRLLSSGYTRFIPKMTLLRGLDMPPDTNHNDGGMLGNYQGSNSTSAQALTPMATIDQVLAFSNKFYTAAPRLRSLHLSPGNPNSISYTHDGNPGGPVRQVQARLDPLAAYIDVFGTEDASQGGPSKKLPNLNAVFEDYRRHVKHPRLGAGDRQMLERHMQFLTELEGRVGRVFAARCVRPARPTSIPNQPVGGGLTEVDSIMTTYDIMIDTLVAAILCDHTRIVTLDMRKVLSMTAKGLVGWYHEKSNPGSWHGEAHEWGTVNADRNIFEINRWMAEEVVLKVLQKLDVPEDGGKTYLDNSLVFWGNELGFNHVNTGVPALLVGGAGGRFNMGRYLDYTDWYSRSFFAQQGGNAIQGLAHNRLLVSIMQAMGLSPGDYERTGKPGYGHYTTQGKQAGLFPVGYDKDQGEVLPGLFV